MKHIERLQLAKHICKKLKEKYGSKILVAGVYGSLSRNQDKEDSDLDLILITKNNVDRIEDKFMYKGIPVAYWSIKLKDAKNKIQYPCFDDWPWALNSILDFKPLVGDKTIPKKLKELCKKVPYKKHKKAIANYLPAIYEWNTKIQKSYKKKDVGEIRFAIWDTMNGILGCIALLNKKYFIGNGYGRFRESFKYKIKPKNYKKLVEIAWKSKDSKKAVKAFNELFRNFEELMEKEDIRPKKYEKLKDLF